MRIFNKRASFEYHLYEHIEAGITLTGGEAKAIRLGHANLTNSYAKVIADEVVLVNGNIAVAGAKYSPTRSRKLLLHKKEIVALESKMKAQRLTLVPVSMYTKGRFIKIELALAKSKRQFEKRKQIRERDIKRDLDRELRIKG